MSVDIAADIFKVTVPEPWSVRLDALVAGDSLLRIVDPSNGELFGSTTLHSVDISRIRLKALDYQSPDEESESGPFRFVVGSSWYLMAALESADAKRLVDEGLSLHAEPEGRVQGYSNGKLVQGVEWTIDTPEPPELMLAGLGGNCGGVWRKGEKGGVASVTIHGGGQSITLQFEVVDKTR